MRSTKKLEKLALRILGSNECIYQQDGRTVGRRRHKFENIDRESFDKTVETDAAKITTPTWRVTERCKYCGKERTREFPGGMNEIEWKDDS